MTTYYGLAIRRHPNSAKDMKNAVWAVYYHNISSDKNPQHMYCPEGKDSWWRVAEANGSLKSLRHKPPLIDKVSDAIKPVFEALSSDDLMEWCTGGNTQNSNESVNACVWKLAPKHLHSAAKTIEIATYIGVSLFNKGHITILKIMELLEIVVGLQAHNFVRIADDKRIAAAEKSLSDGARAAASAKKFEQAS